MTKVTEGISDWCRDGELDRRLERTSTVDGPVVIWGIELADKGEWCGRVGPGGTLENVHPVLRVLLVLCECNVNLEKGCQQLFFHYPRRAVLT